MTIDQWQPVNGEIITLDYDFYNSVQFFGYIAQVMTLRDTCTGNIKSFCHSFAPAQTMKINYNRFARF